jgi:glutamate N-acetyltransferase/amino-acid N-acetyltransferase
MNRISKAWKTIEGGISAPEGFYATGVRAGIKYKEKYDVAIIYSDVAASAAGVFTRNLVKAHPLVLTQKHLENGRAQAVVVNSGNANACMGDNGDLAAQKMAEVAAEELELPIDDVLVSSTGVIGQPLPIDKVVPGIKKAVQEIKTAVGEAEDGMEKTQKAHQAALAIMTTDTAAKEQATQLETARGPVKLGIMAKGSGMIHPNMGTMLCFITTDAKIKPDQLQNLVKEAADESFNMVTVDGDTSTNDMVAVLANGRSEIELTGEDWENFSKMFREACCEMAMAIARDGEGASKFLEIEVTGAKSLEDARKIARSVCSSSLVKSAMYGEDANWGRILAAAGYSGAYFNPDRADIYLNQLQVASNGQGIPFSENEAFDRLKQKDIRIAVNLQDGHDSARAWGCDLTHQYVDINANYRT